MIDREEIEKLLFVLDCDDPLAKKAAALLRSLLAERDEAIKHAEAMADNYRDYNECAPDDTEGSLQRLHDSVDDFHKWMEGRK